MSDPGDIRVSNDRLNLLRRIASGQVSPDADGVLGAVRDGFVELRERKVAGDRRPWPFVTDKGLQVVRDARTPPPSPTFGKARTVLYVSDPNEERAAIIVDTHADGTANLVVFGTNVNDNRIAPQMGAKTSTVVPMAFVERAPYSSDPSKRGTWHWLAEGRKVPMSESV